VDTLKYILKDICICIIKEKFDQQGESTWRWPGGNSHQIDFLANYICRKVLHVQRGLEFSHSSSELSACSSRYSCRYSIWVLLAQLSISEYRSANIWCNLMLICSMNVINTYDIDLALKYQQYTLEFSTIWETLADWACRRVVWSYQFNLAFESVLQVKFQELPFDDSYLSRFWLITMHGSPEWKCSI